MKHSLDLILSFSRTIAIAALIASRGTASITVQYAPAPATTQPPLVTPAPAPAPPPTTPPPNDSSGATEQGIASELSSFGFSAGIGAIYWAGPKAVNTATVDSQGILRVDFQSPVALGAIFETHFLLNDPTSPTGSTYAQVKQFLDSVGPGQSVSRTFPTLGFGPAVVVGVANNAITTFGLGVTASLRHLQVQATRSGNDAAQATFTSTGNPFNLTLAAVVNPNVNVLGSGLQADKPLPTGATVQLSTRAEVGVCLDFSVGF